MTGLTFRKDLLRDKPFIDDDNHGDDGYCLDLIIFDQIMMMITIMMFIFMMMTTIW